MKHPGLYVPLDVNYARDRAIAAAGEEAELLYVRGLAYAKHTNSDGFIPDFDIDEVAKRLRRVPQRLAALVREGLWIEADGGWLIRNWSRWNESSAELQAKRDRDAERQRKRRAKDTPQSPVGVTADVQRDTAVSPAPNRTEEKQIETGPTSSVSVVLADTDPTTRLLAEHVQAYTEPPPLSAQSKVKAQIMRLVAERVSEDRIRAGLSRMRERQLAASLLPQLVAEATPIGAAHKPSTTDQRVAAGLALVAKYEEAGE